MAGRYITILILSLVIENIFYAYPTPMDLSRNIPAWNLEQNPTILFSVKAEFESDFYDYYSIIQEAAELWTNVDGSALELAEASDDFDTQITIYLQRNIDDSSFSAGYTEVDDYLLDGSPKHCSIYILISDQLSFLATSKTILHEFGHCLGLGHSLVPEAIMSYNLDKNRFALDVDDEAAIARLYSDEGIPKLPPGCAIGIGKKSFSAGSLFLLLLTFLMPLVVALKFLKE